MRVVDPKARQAQATMGNSHALMHDKPKQGFHVLLVRHQRPELFLGSLSLAGWLCQAKP
jgi:hypothetical protein